jgi:hypothetical protein
MTLLLPDPDRAAAPMAATIYAISQYVRVATPLSSAPLQGSRCDGWLNIGGQRTALSRRRSGGAFVARR